MAQLLAIHCPINDQTKFHMVKGTDNAFDHMELCFVIYKLKQLFQINQLPFSRNYFHNRFPSRNSLLPIFLTGGKLGVQVANLLLAKYY